MPSLFSAVFAATVSAVSAQYQFAGTYTITGACDANRVIDGLSFVNEGRTLSGAPYFKALGIEYYLFYDPDCYAADAAAVGKWIIDVKKPNVMAAANLDGTGLCDEVARIDSTDRTRPPSTGRWEMKCAGEVKTQYLILLNTDATTTAQIMPYYPQGQVAMLPLILNGACQYHQALNGMIFDFSGNTATGSPYYKARGSEQYIYYDNDCDGSGPSVGQRWVLDESRPNPALLQDLDNDRECTYHAHTDSTSFGRTSPPASATWHMYCGTAGWQKLLVTLTEARSPQQDFVMYAGGAKSVGLAFVVASLMVFAHLIGSFAA